MKRVLHVMYNLERSGMEKMLLNSGHEWRRRGHLCDVLATADNVGPLAGEMQAAGYSVHHLPFRSRISLLPDLDFVRRFFHLCRSGYDVVHIHTEAGPPLFAFIARLAGVRHIAVTAHNTFRFRGLLRWRKLCERSFVRMLGGQYGMISDGVSEWEREHFWNSGIRIWNWIDTEHLKPARPLEGLAAREALGLRPEEFAIVSIGNCNRVKNHEAILRALPMLPPAIRPVYLHIGREEQGCPERALAEALGVQNRVRFLGSQADVRPFLWAADTFVMPSLHEGLGLAAIEAVAAGVPLVCAEVDGLTDIAAATRYTILTSTTPESVAGGLAYAASLPLVELRNRALEDSRTVRERFSIHNGVQSIVCGLYAENRKSPAVARQAWRHS